MIRKRFFLPMAGLMLVVMLAAACTAPAPGSAVADNPATVLAYGAQGEPLLAQRLYKIDDTGVPVPMPNGGVVVKTDFGGHPFRDLRSREAGAARLWRQTQTA